MLNSFQQKSCVCSIFSKNVTKHIEYFDDIWYNCIANRNGSHNLPAWFAEMQMVTVHTVIFFRDEPNTVHMSLSLYRYTD